jgi:hypothetical protein
LDRLSASTTIHHLHRRKMLFSLTSICYIVSYTFCNWRFTILEKSIALVWGGSIWTSFSSST